MTQDDQNISICKCKVALDTSDFDKFNAELIQTIENIQKLLQTIENIQKLKTELKTLELPEIKT